MKIEKLLKQLKREFIKVNIIQASLDSLLFFLTSNLILFLFSINLLSSITNKTILAIFTAVFFIGDLAWRTYNYRLEIYEEKNPQLRELLRTARDNTDKRNIVSQSLFEEVLSKAENVEAESIIPSKKIIEKIIIVGALSFLTVLSGLTSFQVSDTKRILGQLNLDNQNKTNKINGNFTLENATMIEVDQKDITFKDKINIKIEGEGETSKSEFTFSDEEKASLKKSFESLNENLILAKKYNLAIKKLE
ncbi:MAG: hypothetical protein ABEI78_01215 [Candidatus Nanohaloarchaea archaeon]